MPYSFGVDTETKILKSESHKLFQEFEVVAGTDLKIGQPVVLEIAGTVDLAADGDGPDLVIGIAVQDADAGELVTVMMRGHAIIFCEWKAASSNAGAVTYDAYNAVTGYVEVDDDTVGVTNMWGWALDAGEDGDITRVALL
jgi:hypothetical protein